MSAYECVFFLEIIIEDNLVFFAHQLEDHDEDVVRKRNNLRASHHDWRFTTARQQWGYSEVRNFRSTPLELP
jgi:hypothetical protein